MSAWARAALAILGAIALAMACSENPPQWTHCAQADSYAHWLPADLLRCQNNECSKWFLQRESDMRQLCATESALEVAP